MTDSDSSAAAALTIRPDGPYIVRGPLDLTDNVGNRMHLPAGRSAALCRCGASTATPFCDGSHATAAFTDDDPAPTWALDRYAAEPTPNDATQ